MNKGPCKRILSIALILAASAWAYGQQDSTFNLEVTSELPRLINRGGVGTYGTNLAKRPSFVSLNGFADMEFDLRQQGGLSFKQETVELFVSSQLDEKIRTEFNIQFEDGAAETDIEYAFLDYEFSEKFILRIGRFYLPTGDYNEYTHKQYIHKAVDDPLTISVSPSGWSDTGMQLRGKLKKSGKSVPYYAIYFVNGLQGVAGSSMETLENGLFLDNNKDKAFGGQFGIEWNERFYVSGNYHKSRYDSATQLSANVFGLSSGYDNGKFYIAGEAHYTKLESNLNEFINLNGLYVLAAYRLKSLEPVLRYDQSKIGSINSHRVTYGFNYYLPKSGFIKVSYENEWGAFPNNELNLALVFTY